MQDQYLYDEAYYADNSQDGDRIALWFYERIARRMAPPGARVLEFGSGTGWFARRLSRTYEVHAYDVSASALEQTRANAPEATVVESLDGLTGSFSLVTALHVLEHIPSPAQALATINSLLTRGGRLLAVVPNPDGLGRHLKQKDWFAYQDPTHCSLLSRDEWINALESAGLHIDEMGTDGVWDFPYRGRSRDLPKLIGAMAMTGAQLLAGRTLLPDGWGECLIVNARKQ